MKKTTSQSGSVLGIPSAKYNLLMGQHFLRDKDVLARIIDAAQIGSGDTVLEVGPGTGVLTRELAVRAKKVIAVEKDQRFVEFLKEKFSSTKNIEIISGDILKINLSSILPLRYIVVANLPYYLTSRFLRIFLGHRMSAGHPMSPARMILMVQRGVAERIVAKPPHMNMLALSVQAFGKPKILFRVPREAFSPKPAVQSAVIEIGAIGNDFFKKNKIAQEKFFALAKRAFQQKRKTLKNSIGISSGKRPQELSLDDWIEITRHSRM